MNGSRAVILGYLAGAITAAPFNPQRDEPFVDELLDDFHDVDILEADSPALRQTCATAFAS